MQRDFLYPNVADHRPPQEWEEDGAQDIRERAKRRTRQILATHFPNHISYTIDKQLRAAFDLQPPEEIMEAP